MTNEAQILDILINEIKALEKNFNNKFENLSNKIDETAESIKTELRAEMREMGESIKTELRVEIKETREKVERLEKEMKEIRETNKDIIDQCIGIANDANIFFKCVDKHNTRIERLELAVFNESYKVYEDENNTYDCK